MREGNQSLPCYDMGKNHFSRHEVRAMPRPATSSMGAVLPLGEIVAYSPTADEEEYDEWRGRVRHFETRVSEIVDHRADQMEQRASEQNAEE